MRPKSLPELEEALILREAGYTLSAIAERTGISASTLTRRFREIGGTPARGKLTAEAVDQARQQLLQDSGFVDAIKHQVASQIIDDLSLSQQIRTHALLTLEQLAEEPPSLKARSLAAIATTTKLTSDVMRRALRIDEAQDDGKEFATFVITKMTGEEIDEVRARFNEEDD